MRFRTLCIISHLAFLVIASAGCTTSKSADGSHRRWHWDAAAARDLDKSMQKSMKSSDDDYVRSKQKQRFDDRLKDLDYDF